MSETTNYKLLALNGEATKRVLRVTPIGIQGAKGSTGPAGTTGTSISGVTYNQGNFELVIVFSNGTTASIGYFRGATGNTGPTGPAGSQGIQGLQGPKGDDGSPGTDGAKGNDGRDGRGIQNSVITNGILTLNYTDQTSQVVGQVVGATGPTGEGSQIVGISFDAQYNVIFTIDSGETFNAGYARGPTGQGITGETGVGISGATLSNFDLIFTYTNGVTQNIGNIRGQTGSTGSPGTNGNTGNTGVGISGATLTNFELIFTYTNGVTQNIGNIRGATGTGIAGGGVGISWINVTSDSGISANTGIIANKNGATLGLTLPAGASLGTIFRITGVTGAWRINQNPSQAIYFGNANTSTGTAGYLESTHRRDSVELVCVVENTQWNVISSIGNITIV